MNLKTEFAIKQKPEVSPILNKCDLSGHFVLWKDKTRQIPRIGIVNLHSPQNNRVLIIKTKRLKARSSMTPIFENTLECVHIKRVLRIN